MTKTLSRRRIPAVFSRGGTSKGVIFHARDLPADPALRDAILLHVLGSPDPNGRQLDGLGGGLSSVSKALIIAPSTRADADVDYTFAQVAVDRPVVDYTSMCGNMSAAVGPFAVEEGLVAAVDGAAMVRIYNTNTDKVVHARFDVRGGLAVEAGDFVIPGVAGSAAPIRLDYLDPGGTLTPALLPSGRAREDLEVPGVGIIEASLVDATNPVVFVRARDVGVGGDETPEALEAVDGLLAKLEAIRRAGAVAMGIVDDPAAAGLANPKVGMLAGPVAQRMLDGRVLVPDSHDITMRMVSLERIHRAVTLTGAKCLACAALVPGSLAHELRRGPASRDGALRIGTPSGVVTVAAAVEADPACGFRAVSATSYRTQRRIMDGHVLVKSQDGT